MSWPGCCSGRARALSRGQPLWKQGEERSGSLPTRRASIVLWWSPGPGARAGIEAQLRALRPATDEDRVNVAAEQAINSPTRGGVAPPAWLERIYLEAAHAWESLGRVEREADARFRLGQIRAEMRDWQGALEAQRRASELFHLVGARQSEVLALDRIADVHQTLGET